MKIQQEENYKESRNIKSLSVSQLTGSMPKYGQRAVESLRNEQQIAQNIFK